MENKWRPVRGGEVGCDGQPAKVCKESGGAPKE